jgi:hypothetical protein
VLRFTKELQKTKKKKKKPQTKANRSSGDEPGPPTLTQPTELPAIVTPLDGELQGYNVLMEDETASTVGKHVETGTELPFVTPRAKSKRNQQRVQESSPLKSTTPGALTPDDDEDGDSTPYGVDRASPDRSVNLPEELVKPREDEMRLISRDDRPIKPRRVWGPEAVTFLFQPGTISAVIIASGFCFAVGLMVRIARAFNPATGAD